MSNFPPRKRKRLCVYLPKWEQRYNWITPVRNNNFKAHCAYCKREFSITHGGESDVKQHASTAIHQSSAQRQLKAPSQHKSARCLVKEASSEQNSVTASELALCYHNVKHNISYSSSDCSAKLTRHIFRDSATASKLCAEATVMNVLAQKSVEDFVTILKSPQNASNFFALATDASDKGNRTLFPVCLRFFDPCEGICWKVLDIVEEHDESSSGIYDILKKCIQHHGLFWENVSSYSDNASINFGRNKSVSNHLQNENSYILKANCNTHMIHNCCKYGCEVLDIDVETVIIKTFGHFSSSTKRRAELMPFFEFVDCEFSKLLSRVPTKWLTLGRAVDPLLQNFEAICSYFRSISNSECPAYLKQFFQDENVFKSEMLKIYLAFFCNVSKIFCEVILVLERSNLSITEAYDTMVKLREKLVNGTRDNFEGIDVKPMMNDLLPKERQRIIKNFQEFYKVCVQYLEKSYDFSENNIFKHLKVMDLEKVEFSDWVRIIEVLKFTEICTSFNFDYFYEECSVFKPNLRQNNSEKFESVEKKWVSFFTKNDPSEMPNLYLLLSYILSIPGSNTSVERVFSILNTKWNDERSKCSLKLIKSEIQIAMNYNYSCQAFFDIIRKDEAFLT